MSMTIKELQNANSLAKNIFRHKEILKDLEAWREDTEQYKICIVEYFSRGSLFDPSLMMDLKVMLDREIAAAKKCIKEEVTEFEAL